MISNSTPHQGFLQADNTWVIRGGIAGLFIYAGFWLLNIEISRAGESLMVLFFLLAMFSRQRKLILSEPILYLMIAWVLFQLGVYHWAADNFPALREDHINEARTITNVFMFVVVAWWFGGNSNRVAIIFSLCVLGYLVGATFNDRGLIDEINQLQSHARLWLSYKNPEHASVYSAFILLTLLALQARIISLSPDKYKWLVKVFIYTGIIYSIFAIIATQTRATWLGLLITGVIATIIYIHRRLVTKRKKKEFDKTQGKATKLILLLLISGVATGLLIATDATEIIAKRIQTERDVISKIVEGNTEDIPLSSIGIRIKIWSMGYDWFKERPLTGWGPQSRKELFYKGNQPEWMKKQIRHLHNSYLELLVAYGLIGLGVFVGLFIYIWYRAYQAWRNGYIPNDIMLFSALWSVYWLVVNCFESYVIYSATGNYLNALVAGILYSYHLSYIQNKRNKSSVQHV